MKEDPSCHDPDIVESIRLTENINKSQLQLSQSSRKQKGNRETRPLERHTSVGFLKLKKKSVFLEIYFKRKIFSKIIVLHKEIFSNLYSKDQKKNKTKGERLFMNREGNFGPTKSLIAKVTS